MLLTQAADANHHAEAHVVQLLAVVANQLAAAVAAQHQAAVAKPLAVVAMDAQAQSPRFMVAY